MKISELKNLVRFELNHIKGKTAYGTVWVKHRSIPYTFPAYEEGLTQEEIQYDVWNWARLALEHNTVKKFCNAIDARNEYEGAFWLAHRWHVSNTFLSMLFDAGVSCDEVVHMTNYWEKGVNKNGHNVA